MSDDTKWVKYNYVVKESDKATLFSIKGKTKPVWIPKSVQVDIDEGDKEVEVQLWFADKEELY